MTKREDELSALLDRLEPEVARAFRESMAAWRDSVDLKAFQAAVAAGDVEGAIAALHLDPGALQPLLDELASAYTASGQSFAGSLPRLTSPGTGARFVLRFNGRDPVAEAWLRNNAATLVTRVTEAQKEAIRAKLVAGLAAGSNPRTTALEIVGRIGATGAREGGIIGLTVPQAEHLQSARDELASAEPAGLRNYLTRKLRDRRFDAAVAKALETGKPIPADTREKMLTSYSNRLLKLRGDTLAQRETLHALHAGEYEGARQAAATGAVQEKQMTKTWRDARDRKVRHTHRVMNGQKVAFAMAFTSPSGAMLMHPGDTSLGAPTSEVMGCRCVAPVRIDFLAKVA